MRLTVPLTVAQPRCSTRSRWRSCTSWGSSSSRSPCGWSPTPRCAGFLECAAERQKTYVSKAYEARRYTSEGILSNESSQYQSNLSFRLKVPSHLQSGALGAGLQKGLLPGHGSTAERGPAGGDRDERTAHGDSAAGETPESYLLIPINTLKLIKTRLNTLKSNKSNL